MAQYDINLREYWRILKKRKFIVLLTALAVGVFSTAFTLLKAPPPIYSAVCSVKFEKETTVEGLYTKTLSWSVGNDIDTQISIIDSYSVFAKVAERLGLIKKAANPRDNHLKAHTVRIIDNLQSKVEVTRQGFTNIMNIEVTDRDPAFVQKLANTIAETYRDLHAENQMKRTTEAIKYINDQLMRVGQQLKESEEAFNSFSKENKFISFNMQSETLVARAHEIRIRIQELQGNKHEFEDILKRLNRFVKNPYGSEHDFYSQRANTQYQNTNGKFVDLLLKRDTLLKDFTPRHPDVIAINNRITENASKLAYLIELQIRGIEAEMTDYRQELQRVEEKARGLLDKKLEYDRLKRSVDSYTDMMALLEQKEQEAMIRMAEKPEEVTIVKPALLPTSPINPPKTATTGGMGILIGFVLGLVVAFVVETFDTSLGAIEDVEGTLGTEVLGIIPHGDYHHAREDLKNRFPGKITEKSVDQALSLITHFLPKSIMAENFRALRTNVLFKETEENIKTLAITSTAPEEGKTLIAANLAITMAQAGMKTLLVGSDLRRPMLSKVLGVDRSPGLTDILMGSFRLRDTVKTVSDMIVGEMALEDLMVTPGLENLYFITCGSASPNPTELLNSTRFEDFVEEAKEHYDMIIFDSSPILSTADAVVLGTKVDSVLLVYRVGVVSRGLLKRSSTQLRQVKCRIMGVVLNGMKPDVSPDFHDYKYYHYYYTHGEEDKDHKKRVKKKGFPFFKRKGEDLGATEIEGSGVWSKKQKKNRSDISRLSLLLVAFAFLAGTSLGQMGFFDSVKMVRSSTGAKEGESKAVINEELQKQGQTAVHRMVVLPIPARPKPNANSLSMVQIKLEAENKGSSVEDAVPRTERVPIKAESQEAAEPPTHDSPSSGSRLEKPLPVMFYVEGPPARQVADAAAPSANPFPSKSVQSMATEEPMFDTEISGSGVSQPSQVVSQREEPGEELTMVASVSESLPETKTSADPQKPQVRKGNAAYPYSVRLSVCHSLRAAKAVVDSYGEKGINAYWVKVNLEKGIRYRVFTGHFASYREAGRFMKEKQLKGSLVQKTPYSAQVGTYAPDEEELHKRIQSLRKLDCCPYVVSDGEGNCKLFVGAFITREGAEEQQQELAFRGIGSRPVKR